MSFLTKCKELFFKNKKGEVVESSSVDTPENESKYLDRSYYSDSDWLKLTWLAENVKTWGVHRYEYVSCRRKESVNDDGEVYQPVYAKRPSMSERYFSKSEFYDMKRELGLMEDYQ